MCSWSWTWAPRATGTRRSSGGSCGTWWPAAPSPPTSPPPRASSSVAWEPVSPGGALGGGLRG
ncbi:hypothetical protein RLOC_00004131, partial [Lonchura striata]